MEDICNKIIALAVWEHFWWLYHVNLLFQLLLLNLVDVVLILKENSSKIVLTYLDLGMIFRAIVFRVSPSVFIFYRRWKTLRTRF